MTKHLYKTRDSGGVCRVCDHDLMVRDKVKPGEVFCSNSECRFHEQPYALTSERSQGKRAPRT